MRACRLAEARGCSRQLSFLGRIFTVIGLLHVSVREVRKDDLRKKTPLEWYNQELARKPRDVGLLFAKGALLAKMGEHEDAIACFEKVTDLDPDHYKGWDAVAKAYFRIGRYEESISALDRLIEMDEGNETIWYHKGEALLRLGRYVEANECYDRAIELNPNYADAWCGKGNALKGIGKETLQSRNQGGGSIASREKVFEDALDCFKKVMSLNPNHYEAMGSRGTLLCEMGEYEEGLKEIDRAVEGHPNLYEPLIQKAKVLQLQGREQEAKRVLERTLEQSLSSAEAKSVEDLYWRGVVATETGHYETALDSFDRILVLNPTHVDAWVAKGNALVRMGNGERALGCFDEALSLRENLGNVWYLKGNTQRDLGRLEDALFSYEKATSTTPQLTDAWYEKGLVQYAAEELRGALLSFLKVLELLPSHRGASKMKDQVTSKLFSRVDKALELSRRKVKKWESRLPPGRRRMIGSGLQSKEKLVHNGIRYFSQQKYGEALECFSLAIEIEDGDYTLWEWKGDTLVKLDRYSEAIDCYDRAVKLKYVDRNMEGKKEAGAGFHDRAAEGVEEEGSLGKVSKGRRGMPTDFESIGNGKPQEERFREDGRGFSISELDKSILDIVAEKPRTIREISRLCKTEVPILFSRIEMLRTLGFLKRLRIVVSLDKGARRICFYKAEADRLSTIKS